MFLATTIFMTAKIALDRVPDAFAFLDALAFLDLKLSVAQ